MSVSRFKSGVYFTSPEDGNEQGKRPSQSSHFPLLSVSIHVNIESNISASTITQKYTNQSSSPAEHTKYLFPIYDGSAVTSFKCWIGKDKLLEGAVKAKQQARKEFAEAISKHKAAVLVEELTPEIFEANLGNIPSQTDVTVEITLATQLKGDQTTSATTLTIPTSVAPRYGYQPAGYTHPETASTAAVAGDDALHINVQVSMLEQIRKIESQTHTISVTIGPETGVFDPCKASASLAGRSAVLEKDFVLTILSNSKEWMVSRAIAVPQPDSNKSTIALSLSPGDLFRKKFSPDNFTGEVIFVADRSGSMNNEMPALRDAMNVFLRSLPDQCSFNILSFGSRFSYLWEAAQPYNQEILDQATSHVDSFEADFGGTKILRALESIPKNFNKRADVPTNVIVLTDGETWDVEKVIEFVTRTASDPEMSIRFFALGIGNQVSHRLVQGIGLRGGGSAEVISDTRSSLVWQGRMIQMLKNALTPSRLRCSISFDGLAQNGNGWLQAPHSIPPLNAFSHLTIYYVLDREIEKIPDTVTITAVTEDETTLTAQLVIHRSNISSTHHLAAKAFMNDYETGQSWLHAKHESLLASDQDAFNQILEHEAQEIGIRWSIPSRWTSYVAVDRTSQEDHETSLEAAERDESLHSLEDESDEDMGFGLYDGTSPTAYGSPQFCPTSPSFSGGASPNFAPSPPSRTRGGGGARRMLDTGTPSSPPAAPSVMGCFGGGRIATGGARSGGVDSRMMFTPSSPSYSPSSPQYMPTSPVGGFSGFRPKKAKKSKVASRKLSEPAEDSKEPSDPELTLSKVLYLQAANGDMRVEGSDIEALLVAEFQPKVLENMSSLLASFSVKLDTTERTFLLNVLAVVYVAVKCVESKGLWEMQITKARRYLKKRLDEAAVGIDSKASLEQLESMGQQGLVQK
ncbi:VIT and vWA domain-containing protein [Aspergillus affinis]|uniref:VIT and vWA domain-containing protein n=1 Tax=Aspergillus affinis TaxID=1070780 RepID=UPI0022FF3CD4|nr:vWA-like protein [Aspergillus affinis]KAI9037340.1 vWA-like protein [Aspergillus affinis]